MTKTDLTGGVFDICRTVGVPALAPPTLPPVTVLFGFDNL